MSAHGPFLFAGLALGWSLAALFYSYGTYRDSLARIAEARRQIAQSDERTAELVTLYRETYGTDMPNMEKR